MPNCKKVPGTAPGRLLAMSVIEEEPAHMRESRVGEVERHADHIKLSTGGAVEEREAWSPPLRPDSRSDTAIVPSRSAAISVDDKDHASRKVRVAIGPRRSSRLDFRQDSTSKTHSSPRRHKRSPRHRERPTHAMPGDPEYMPRSKTVTSSSSEEDDNDDENQPQRLPRRHLSRPSTNCLKAPSIPPSQKSSVPLERQPLGPPLSSLDKSPRTKKATRLDSIHLPTSKTIYECHARPSSRQAPRPQPHLRVNAKSSAMLPPFREPFAERGLAQVEASCHGGARPEEEPMLGRLRRPGSPRVPNIKLRSKSSSPLNTVPSVMGDEKYEDRRTRAFRDLSPPSAHRSPSILHPRTQTQTRAGQRQVASCRGLKEPMSPTNMKRANCKDRPETALLQNRNSRRTRSTSLRLNKLLTPDLREESLSRSASASSLSSQDSTPSPRASVPQIPLRLRHYEGRFSNRRKQTLFYFSLFPPEKRPMRGVVVCLHGIGDHCRRNVKLYERLCREGFGVITYDLLNHGVSDLDQHKTRAHISNFNHLVDDTNDFITFAKRFIFKDALRYWRKRLDDHDQAARVKTQLQPELPLIIAGTSFGSLIGIHTVLASEHTFHAAVWGSPTVGITWNPLLWAESKLAKPLAAILPTAKVVPAVSHERLCRDPKFLRRFKADPLTSMDMMTSRTGHESLQAMIQLEDDKRVTTPGSAFCAVPTLFLAGSADSVSDQQAAIKFFGTMGNFDKEFKLFDGLFHLVYEEPEKEDVFRYLARWLHRRFPLD